MDIKDRAVKSVFLITILSILGKVTGFFREAAIAAYYGVSGATDAFFVAYSLPTVLFIVIGASMGIMFVPIYTQQLNKGSKEGNAFASSIINMVLLASLMSALLGTIFSSPIIRLIAPRLPAQSIATAADLARVMFPIFVFISLSYIMTGILQTHGSFAIPSMVSIPSNIIVILGIILFSSMYDINALAWATLIGGFTQLAIQFPGALRRLKYRFRFNFKDPAVLKYWGLIIPVILGTAVDKINIMIDNALASSLSEGSISAINYSTKFIDFADSIAIGAIVMVAYPKLAKMGIEKDHNGLGRTAYSAAMAITQIVLPMIAIAIIFNNDIVKILFERGAFAQADTRLTAYALAYYALGIWGMGVRGILNRVFYSLGDSATPMKISLATLTSNIILNLLLVKHMGIGGLGLATSLSATLGAMVLFTLIRKKIRSFDVKSMLKESIKAMAIVSFTAYIILACKRFFTVGNAYIEFILLAGIGLVIYVKLSLAFNVGLTGRIKPQRVHQDINAVPGLKLEPSAPVSVIIVCYKCMHTIERAVSSVWNQSWRPKEVILVEDASPDCGVTRSTLRKIAKGYPAHWLKVIYLIENGGPGSARNVGWNLASQEYIAFLDADDAWHPQKVEIQLGVMFKNPDVSICGHNFRAIKGSANEAHTIYTKTYFKKVGIDKIQANKALLANRIFTSSVMIKNREVEHRFQDRKYYSEDYLLWMTMMLSGHKALKIDMVLYYIYKDNGTDHLSGKLWRMQKGEADTYRKLRATGFIDTLTLILLLPLSYTKFIKRVIFQGITNVFKKIHLLDTYR